jgi:hypothetical protein
MKLKPAPLLAGLCLISAISTPAFADTAAAPNEDQLIQNLSQKTTALEKELGQLRHEVRVLKKNKAVASKASKATVATTTAASALPSSLQSGSNPKYVPVQLFSDEPMYLGGTPVTTSPYLGVRSRFDANEIVSYIPKANEDLKLLSQIQSLKNVYHQNGWPFPDHPFMDFSGQIAAYTYEARPASGNKTSDIDVPDAELDALIVFDPWVTGFMTVNYDNTLPQQGPRTANSRFFMDRGFITIGNLERAPVYGTVGQFYVPFGQYLSNMVSAPLTQTLGQTRERAVTLGYDYHFGDDKAVNGLNAAVYAFKGDAHATNSNNGQVNEGGVNAGYYLTEPKWNFHIAAGLLSNLADSLGLQNTGAPTSGFNGFGGSVPTGGSSVTENLVHRVPGFDTHTAIGLGDDWALLGEYVTATTRFNNSNLTFNGHGAKPSALHTELDYTIPYFQDHTTIALIGYEQTKDALALLMPQKRYLAALMTSIWKDTIEDIEYRHDVNYSTNSSASGQGASVTTSGLGHTADQVSLQFTAFF